MANGSPEIERISAQNGVVFEQIKPGVLIEQFTEIKKLDSLIENIGWCLVGALAPTQDLLSTNINFIYAENYERTLKYTHEYNPQTMKGIFSASTKPSVRLQPTKVTTKVTNPRVLFLEPPERLTSDFLGATTKSSAFYTKEKGVLGIAAADVRITGSGVIAHTLGEFIMWPHFSNYHKQDEVSMRWARVNRVRPDRMGAIADIDKTIRRLPEGIQAKRRQFLQLLIDIK